MPALMSRSINPVDWQNYSENASATGGIDDAHERRPVVYDNKGNGLVFYKPLAR